MTENGRPPTENGGGYPYVDNLQIYVLLQKKTPPHCDKSPPFEIFFLQKLSNSNVNFHLALLSYVVQTEVDLGKYPPPPHPGAINEKKHHHQEP